MRFERLRLQNLRCFDHVELAPEPGINLLLGPNGAGKTSVLEAVYLLSHGRSFRAGGRDVLVRRGERAFSVYAELTTTGGARHRLGLGREAGRWTARLDGEPPESVGDLLRHCAVVCFEPGSHALIAGGSEERRGFLDWGVFHVEPEFLPAWRRYQRALRQRNTLLRQQAPAGWLTPWEAEMAAVAAVIDTVRRRYLQALSIWIGRTAEAFLAELGPVRLSYRRGWPEGAALLEHLAERRGQDYARGHSTAGPHRADWALAFPEAPAREHLSRGQEKLCALACVLAQAELHAERRGEWPMIGLDDLASELDQTHQRRVVERLTAGAAQVLVTGTELPPALAGLEAALFHVEQGRIERRR
ncbi:DNA replication and repair protein RecF [Mizugakiibacter sediminis]|uniref:DNA replication and repair protein RecF n=1 Tax=Mizugakiibacter sediminis TaxID=1475481 RepID=A0A0K8QIV7_9GAMM|nr:DNA replication/repair protein RecF [Mizugakiibacter sediminis]GAP64773.1 DNA replication and repair protein RecF [Mizugakiibacter sediminis]